MYLVLSFKKVYCGLRVLHLCVVAEPDKVLVGELNFHFDNLEVPSGFRM